MKPLSLTEIANAVDGKLYDRENLDLSVSGVCIDSRKAIEGDLFFALIGENVDGHKYVASAIGKGAVAAIISIEDEDYINELKKDAGNEKLQLIIVKDVLVALQELAKFYISKFDVKKIAVTGSTGKTTTKEFLYEVLSSKYNVLKNRGNFNNHIGVPLTAFQLEEDHEIAIFEMGMSGLEEIELLANIVKPDVAIITNIGMSHIEKLGSRENILKAKLEVTKFFNEKSILVINNDDEMLATVDFNKEMYRIIRVGKKQDSDFEIIDINVNGDKGIDYKVKSYNDISNVNLKMVGAHNSYNATFGIACGSIFDIDVELGSDSASKYVSNDKRLSIVRCENDITLIDDTYNASPDSMKAAIDVLAAMEGKRKVAILADMFEIGEFEKECHFEIGTYAKNMKIDSVIAVGENGKYIYEGSKKSEIDNSRLYFKDKKSLIKELDNIIEQGDVILVKASRGMAMEEIVEKIQKNRS